MSTRQKKRKTYTAVIVGLSALAIAIVVLILMKLFLVPGIAALTGEDSNSGVEITMDGKFQTTSGEAVAISGLTMQSASTGKTLFQGNGDGTGAFSIKGMQYNTGYLMTITDSSGTAYTGNVQFYHDTDASFGNFTDGMEFGVSGSDNTVHAVLSVNDKKALQCVKIS